MALTQLIKDRTGELTDSADCTLALAAFWQLHPDAEAMKVELARFVKRSRLPDKTFLQPYFILRSVVGHVNESHHTVKGGQI
jgi:hypothetical protein